MKKFIAEFIGTFVLVTFGCGSAVAANSIFLSMSVPLPIAFTTLLIAFAFGLSIVAMAYSIGNISGCHVNPAVSLGMFITKRISLSDFIVYIVAQFAGASVGAMFLWFCFGAKDSLGQNGYGSASAIGASMGVALVLETVLTCIFVLVVLGVTSKKEYGSVAGLVIGLTLTMIHIFGIPFTGTSVNPARSFGPAMFVGGDALSQLPVFIIAPLVGGVLASILFLLLFDGAKSDDQVPEFETCEDLNEKDSVDEEDSDADTVDAEEDDENGDDISEEDKDERVEISEDENKEDDELAEKDDTKETPEVEKEATEETESEEHSEEVECDEEAEDDKDADTKESEEDSEEKDSSK